MRRGTFLILLVLVVAAALARSDLFGSDDWRSILSAKEKQLAVEEQHPAGSEQDQGGESAADEEEAADEESLPPRLALGQMIVARFDGSDPSSAFLSRIERGEIGGVILFEENVQGGEAAVAARVQRLQEAVAEGENLPLLVMIDQEGGAVKRLPGPPHSPAARMGPSEAEEEGEATGELLTRLGINVDLAPVVDVAGPGTFLGTRTFGDDPEEVASAACDFAAGLRSRGVGATLKHFPGLGLAPANTDETVVTVAASAEEIRSAYLPYEECANESGTLVMVDSAIYPSLTGDAPAVMSPQTYQHELPQAGATGVTISDDLEAPAIQNQATPARRSINAGLDLLLYARTESTSAYSYDRLLEDFRAGNISAARVNESAAKILMLKQELLGMGD